MKANTIRNMTFGLQNKNTNTDDKKNKFLQDKKVKEPVGKSFKEIFEEKMK